MASRRPLTNALMLGLALNLVPLTIAQSAHAGVVGSLAYIQAEARGERIDRISAFLARDAVRTQLSSLGVDGSVMASRLAQLTDAELLMLEQQISDLPAGADSGLAVIGILFVVLLILELVGVTDIFSKI